MPAKPRSTAFEAVPDPPEASEDSEALASIDAGRLGGGAPPEAIFDRLRTKALETDRARFASLEGAELVSARGDAIELAVPAAFHAERLRARLPELEALAGELFGRPLRISVEVNGARAGRNETSESRERSRKRRQEALNSEPVNLAIELLNAEIVEIRPLGDKP
jgi:hypothetical protein